MWISIESTWTQYIGIIICFILIFLSLYLYLSIRFFWGWAHIDIWNNEKDKTEK